MRRHAIRSLRCTGALLALAAFGVAPAAQANAGFPYPDPQTTHGDVQVHDPMMEVRPSAPRYALFSTGEGIPMRTSTDRVTFAGPTPAFPPGTEPWWWAFYTKPTDPTKIWGPDVSFHNGKYWMYYAASYYNSPYDAIGLATSATGLPGSWQDQGVVIASDATAGDPYEAIGANLLVTPAGQWYLTFGTHGIWQIALDPNTGKRPATNPPAPINIAEHNAGGTEAPFVYRHAGYYYLFTSWGSCCTDRANTTYNVRVSRSTSPTGPYTDRSGVAALSGGGTLVLEGHGAFIISTGHSGVFFDSADNQDHLTYHYYANVPPDYPSYLGMNVLNWTEGDWPYLMHDYGPQLPEPYRIFSGDYLSSQNGAYTLKVQLDCNLVERRTDTGVAVWSSGTNGLGTNCRLVMGDNGKLTLYNGDGDLLWSRGAAGDTSTQYRLVMQNDGNVVVYTAANQVWWSRY